MHTKEEKTARFGRLLDIMDRLRTECPWNGAQTFDSLRPLTIEETYELNDAILKRSDPNIEKELGDLLLHIVFYSRIAQEEGRFDAGDVIDSVCEKMIYRHPHVFSDGRAASAEEVSQNWEMLKTREQGGYRRVLSGVPDALPSLLKAYLMQDKARGVGFDWEEKHQVWDKVKEEEQELEAELMAMDRAAAADQTAAASDQSAAETHRVAVAAPDPSAAFDRAEEELGDFLFALVNAARLYGIDSDKALHRACDKFRRRFAYLEEQTLCKGRNLTEMTLAEMDAIWDEGKAKGL